MGPKIPQRRSSRTSSEAIGEVFGKIAEHRRRLFARADDARLAEGNFTPEQQKEAHEKMSRALAHDRLDDLVTKGRFEDRDSAERAEFERVKAEIVADGRKRAWGKQAEAAKRKLREQDSAGIGDFSDEANRKHFALEEERIEFVQRNSPKEDLERFYRERFIPEFNGLGFMVRLCLECWQQFAVTHGNADHCSDACAAKAREARRQETKRASARALEEAVRAKRTKHKLKCFICRGGGSCSTWETIEEGMRQPPPRSVRTTGLVSVEVAEALATKKIAGPK
jgi:hypothetical protein